MFNRNPKTEVHPLDEVIAHLISGIEGLEDGDELHTNAVNSLKTLMELRNADKAARRTVNPDVIAAAVAQFISIGMILSFEKVNVLTSKSLAFVSKVK